MCIPIKIAANEDTKDKSLGKFSLLKTFPNRNEPKYLLTYLY
jgi:hypothetical protein